MLYGLVELFGTSIFGTSPTTDGVFCGGSVRVEEQAALRVNGSFWGSYSISTLPKGWVNVNSQSAVTGLQTTGALQVESQTGSITTGAFYTAGVWTDGVTITPANIHAHGSLLSPAYGCGYSDD